MFGIWRKKQSQSQEGSGLAVQAGQDVIINVTNNGLTAADARSIALDVFKANLMEFKGLALQTAMQRGEEVTDKFIAKLQESNPEGIQEALTPDFQDALFTVQKEYAKANDEELGDLLVNLLVDRSKQANRNLMQLVLTQSLSTAPKLTSGQIAALSVVFILRHVQHLSNSPIGLRGFLALNLQPLIAEASTSTASFGQLEFAGCGKTSMVEVELEAALYQTYCGVFSKGFDPQRLVELELPLAQYPWAFWLCESDPSKYQVNAISTSRLKELLDAMNLDTGIRSKIELLFNEGLLSPQEMSIKLLEQAPFLEPLFAKWNSCNLKRFELTSVGMAIAHANLKRITGVEIAPLSIWIN